VVTQVYLYVGNDICRINVDLSFSRASLLVSEKRAYKDFGHSHEGLNTGNLAARHGVSTRATTAGDGLGGRAGFLRTRA
jgi:hypothetical protein